MAGATPLPPVDPHAVMRACHERRLDRDGVPMFLALVDERPRPPSGRSAPVAGPGDAVLGDLAEAYADLLLPSRRPADEGAVITVLQVLAYAHFEPQQVPADALVGEPR